MKGNSTVAVHASATGRMTPIAAAVAVLAMGMAMSAQAQEAASPENVVTVTGMRASLQQSLNQKRNAESLVEVITAEDIGKMPDKNVADSLSRVAGVTTTSAGSAEGSFGENEHVQLRGMLSQLTLTTLNGHTVSSGDWYGPNIAAGGRSVSYTLLPSDLVGRIVVHKSSQADLTEGGAAGTVDIQTRRPLEFKERLTTSASLEAAYSSAAKSTDPSVSALVNWKNDDNTFGILAQVFSQTRKLQRAGSEGVWWDKTGATYPDPALANKNISLLSGAVLFEQERKRQGGYVEAQWKPQSNVTLDLSAFLSTVDAKNYNTNYMADTINAVNGPGWNGVAVRPTGAATVSGNTITSIFFDKNAFGASSAGAFSVVEDVAARPDAKTDSKFVNLDAKWVVNPDLTVNGKLGHTTGSGKTKDVGFEVLSGWNQGAGYSLTSDGIFVLNVPGGDKFVKAGGGIGGWGSYSESTDKETYGQVDADLKLESSLVPSLKFGARFAKHERQLTKLAMTLGAGAADEGQIPDSAIGNYDANWYGNLPVNPTPGFRPFKISNDYVASWVAKYANFNTHAYQQEFDIKEDATAAYLMANLQPSEMVSGNAGVRVVRTKMDIEAYLPGGAPSYSQSFTDVLPSLNLRADFSKDLIARFAVNRGMSRPEFGQLAGNDLQDLQHTGVGSNPYLKPIRSNNLDLSVEWYFAPKALLSLGIFHSKLDGIIAYGHSILPYADASKAGVIANYDISAPINTDGRLNGLAAAYEQNIWGGFGLSANYTYADGKQTSKLASGTCNGKAGEDCTLYGTSKNSYNTGAYYEDERFSARVSYSRRSTYKLGNRGGADYFQSANGSLNLSLNYNVNKNITLTVEAQNLNDPLLTVYKTDTTQIAGVYKNGKTIYGGLRLKY
ncbi:iron complex outermembrane receptor protein [Duganella sp. SG902]|uniref:TonB-dependent receptor n=1 Tax=Duganella sp. SG902 TaxID=2587016 RepID=UPI00159E496B|nr:TonB-dependent receptor [Duganella sp. SG902]NVM76577.1 iron complex outermembrane receptor protein [Duganella sp. SG902]